MKLSKLIHYYLIPQPVKRTNTESSSEPEENIFQNKNDKDLSIRNGNNTPIYGLPSILDAFIRGIGRFYETGIDSYFARVGFRFLTENARYASSRGLLNLFQKEKIGFDILSTGLKKSLEITLGTAIIDPNREPDKLRRMGSGFLNMVARLGSRVGLVSVNVLNPEQFSFKTLADEFLSRTLCRVLYMDSESLFIGVACRTIEQFAINEWVRNLPFYNLVLSKLSGENEKNNTVNENKDKLVTQNQDSRNQDVEPRVLLLSGAKS